MRRRTLARYWACISPKGCHKSMDEWAFGGHCKKDGGLDIWRLLKVFGDLCKSMEEWAFFVFFISPKSMEEWASGCHCNS